MRIGIDARFYGSLGKGLGRYTEKLIEHLEQIDQENDYVIILRRENYAEYIPKNPHFTKVEAQYAWYSLAEQTLFVWKLYRLHLDLVHFPHFNVPMLYRKKFIVTIHDLILVHYPTLRNTTRFSLFYGIKFLMYRLVIASAIRRAERIMTVSRFTKDDIEREYPRARGRVTVTYEAANQYCWYLSPDAERELFDRLGLFMTDRMVGEGVSHDILRKYFLYVGNAYPHKNLPIVFAVAKAFPEYRFVLVGKEDYFYRRLKRQAQRAGVSNVLFTGFLSDQELSSLYRFARYYVFPSLYEGFGLPPLEAMAHGTAVVASSRGSLPEILGDAAAWFDPTDAKALISVLRHLEARPLLKHRLRSRGFDRVARYSFRTMAKVTLERYRSIDTTKHHDPSPSQT